jgi:hypothetical protein
MILLWIGLCGTLMDRFREPLRTMVLSIRLDWRLKFILTATALALLEVKPNSSCKSRLRA